ncbi:helix-turn-helix domain-containing protein [Proteiniborus sp. MB09-C3]|uniref:helix-turn-helix domain-containing protein n=1 Tax=Proteiniborus sp. MB09-C3 TaxID=3050072 RepID=UPI00255351E7|nr:helix-turn-helix domain-containing protein [Proteiniborus sp. MB09-C3]WIV13225.1 helix-turn-helix domain-containing protein [Proteiniborus sp. MB09-C3]
MLTNKYGNKAEVVNGMVCGNCGSEDVYTVTPYTMDVIQTAVFLGCSEYKVKDMCRKREIPHLRYGNKPQGKIYFTQKALIEWLEKQERRNWR